MSVQIRNQNSGVLERVAGFNDTDSVLSPISRNPIMNKTVYNALAQKIEKTVSDLVNYYDKSQVYTKTEVRELIGAINTLTIEVVSSLPTQDISSTTIYFVGPAAGTNTYDEYVYVGSNWVKIGDTNIDLTDYITSSQLTTVLQSYYTKSAVDSLLSTYYTKNEVQALVDTKEDVLTFDDAPTAGSNNPVKSSGVKTALDAKQDTLTFDSIPTANSNNPVTSDGIYTAMSSIASGGIRFNTDLNAVQCYNPNLKQWFNIHTNVLDSLDYIRLQYITVNAGTYVTGQPYYLLNENEWELGFDFAFTGTGVSRGALAVNAVNSGLWLGNLDASHFVLRRYNVANDIEMTPTSSGTRHTYVIKSDSSGRKLYLDDTLQGSTMQNYLSSGTKIMFNDAAASGSYHATGRFYGYWYKSNGELVSNLIPVKRRSNGTVGIYDEIRNVFITPTGGSFTAGPEAN